MKELKRPIKPNLSNLIQMTKNLSEKLDRDIEIDLRISSWRTYQYWFYVSSKNHKSDIESLFFDSWEEVENRYFELMEISDAS